MKTLYISICNPICSSISSSNSNSMAAALLYTNIHLKSTVFEHHDFCKTSSFRDLDNVRVSGNRNLAFISSNSKGNINRFNGVKAFAVRFSQSCSRNRIPPILAATSRARITISRCSTNSPSINDAAVEVKEISSSEDESKEKEQEEDDDETAEDLILKNWNPPRYVWRALAAWVIAGQVIVRVSQGKIHWRNALTQLELVGPRSIGVCLLTAAFVGMAFTIQFVREFTRLGLTRSVGGVLGLALSRELSPVVTAIIVAGRVGSAFAAELGTMQVSEQTDTLRVLGTDPVDYLIIPRVLACCVALPVLTLLCFSVAMAASVFLADAVYNVSANIILDSARRALYPWDIVSAMVKSAVFGGLISVVSCAWGVTTLGGAKGVGESTTSAVVISLVCIFVADFALSWCFFQGAGDALKAAMG